MISKKVILTGSFGVGKTSLFKRFIENKFDEKYQTTIGVKVDKKVVRIDDNHEVILILWDIAGEVTQDKVPDSYLTGSSGIIYVFDLTRPGTYLNINDDLAYIRSKLPEARIRIVGNKKDLLDGESLATIIATLPQEADIITSARSGENVESLFLTIAKDVL